ncbi:MAG: hypothetical protein IJ093_00915 [Bacilli bacterium]|nr:hypothetical protein [Bacilli bacterium]
MTNKILIKLIVPDMDADFDVFVPVNEVVWKVKKMLLKCIGDISNNSVNLNEEFILINKDNSRVYTNNEIVIDTDIRNASELLFISKKG